MKELQGFVSSLGIWTAAGEATLRLADLSVRPWRAPCALRTVCGAHLLSLLEFEKIAGFRFLSWNLFWRRRSYPETR